MSVEPEDVRRFLQHFEANWRGHLTNLFLHPVRDGVRDLRRICSGVFNDAYRKAYGQYASAESRARYLDLLKWLKEDQEGAIDFARSCIEYEQLSPDEKTRRHEANAAEGKRQWMERQPASE
jgi:phage gp36-like protein